VVSGLIAGYESAVKLGITLGGITRVLFRRLFLHSNFRKVAAEFFTEVAVLVFVFPILDTIVQFGARGVTWQLGAGSIAGAILALLVAAILVKPNEE
jgi:hypothetical protein